MSYKIDVSGDGPTEDDLRATFGELVLSLRSVTPEGQVFTASLSTGSVTYSEADIPDEDPTDDESDVEEPQ